MDQNEFNELHSCCVSAFRENADQAEVTASKGYLSPQETRHQARREEISSARWGSS
jgi:hypothetical protein